MILVLYLLAQEIPQLPTTEKWTLISLLVVALGWIAGLLVYFIKNWIPKSQYDKVLEMFQEEGKQNDLSTRELERRCRECLMVNGAVLKEINSLISELGTVQNMNTQTLQGINHLLELVLYGGQHGGKK